MSVLTFHGAKGREWQAVVVCGAEEGLVPHASSTTTGQRDEEARLFYVALTRASDHLVITRALTRNGKPVEPSRWLAAVETSQASLARSAGNADDGFPLRTARAPDPLLPWREWRAAVARAAGVSATAFCSDRVLRQLREQPPSDAADLAQRLGLTESAAARLRPLPAD